MIEEEFLFTVGQWPFVGQLVGPVELSEVRVVIVRGQFEATEDCRDKSRLTLTRPERRYSDVNVSARRSLTDGFLNVFIDDGKRLGYDEPRLSKSGFRSVQNQIFPS